MVLLCWFFQFPERLKQSQQKTQNISSRHKNEEAKSSITDGHNIFKYSQTNKYFQKTWSHSVEGNGNSSNGITQKWEREAFCMNDVAIRHWMSRSGKVKCNLIHLSGPVEIHPGRSHHLSSHWQTSRGGRPYSVHHEETASCWSLREFLRDIWTNRSEHRSRATRCISST